MKTYTLYTLTYFFILTAASLSAQTTETVVVEEVEEQKSFQLTGYVDAYFQHVLSDPSADDADTPLGFPTSFTPETRGFSVGNVNLMAEKSLGKVGFVGQVGFGPRAIDANQGGDLDNAGYYIPNLQQLFVTYSPSEAVTFTLGQFGTFVGYEVIDAPANMNYSTSYLFSYGPFFHTGLKVDFAIAEGFGGMVGIFDNTDSRFNTAGYYYGAQLSAEVGGLSAYLNLLTGTDTKNVLNDEDETTLQLDLTATYEVNDNLMFGLNASRKQTRILDESDANPESMIDGDGFTGVALYSTIGLAENFSLSLRGESFTVADNPLADQEGRSVLALTATGNITIGDLRILPEVRFDGGGGFATDYDGGIINFGTDDTDDDSVASFILAAVYAF